MTGPPEAARLDARRFARHVEILGHCPESSATWPVRMKLEWCSGHAAANADSRQWLVHDMRDRKLLEIEARKSEDSAKQEEDGPAIRRALVPFRGSFPFFAHKA